MNIHHTSDTWKILPKLWKIRKLYIKTVQKESEPFEFPVKNVKSRTTDKFSVFAAHIPNKQSNHPKGKYWHIILKYNGIVQGGNYFCENLHEKIYIVSMSMNISVRGWPSLLQCITSNRFSFVKNFFRHERLVIFFHIFIL